MFSPAGYRAPVAGELVRLAIVAGACVAALLAVEVVHRALLPLGRRARLAAELAHRPHRPFQLLVAVYALDIGMRWSDLTGVWRGPVVHLLDLVAIGAGAWLVTGLLFVVEDAALSAFRTDVRDNQQARTVHTQVQVIRRFTAGAGGVLANGAIVMSLRACPILRPRPVPLPPGAPSLTPISPPTP